MNLRQVSGHPTQDKLRNDLWEQMFKRVLKQVKLNVQQGIDEDEFETHVIQDRVWEIVKLWT